MRLSPPLVRSEQDDSSGRLAAGHARGIPGLALPSCRDSLFFQRNQPHDTDEFVQHVRIFLRQMAQDRLVGDQLGQIPLREDKVKDVLAVGLLNESVLF